MSNGPVALSSQAATVRLVTSEGTSVKAAVKFQAPLDTALKELIGDNIVFDSPPTSMSVGKSTKIIARLSASLPRDDLVAQLTEAAQTEGQLSEGSIKNGLMSVRRLLATLSIGGFVVTPPEPEPALLSNPTWSWDIVADRAVSGSPNQSLKAVLVINGKDTTFDIVYQPHPSARPPMIKVEEGWPQTPTEWFEWFKNLFEKFSWLWGTILVPVGVWIWARLRKKPPLGGGSGPAPALDKPSSKG